MEPKKKFKLGGVHALVQRSHLSMQGSAMVCFAAVFCAIEIVRMCECVCVCVCVACVCICMWHVCVCEREIAVTSTSSDGDDRGSWQKLRSGADGPFPDPGVPKFGNCQIMLKELFVFQALANAFNVTVKVKIENVTSLLTPE